MERVQRGNEGVFLKFAKNVFGIDVEKSDEIIAILGGIEKYREFLKKVGMPATLRELGIRDKDQFEDIARCCGATTQSGTIGNFARLSPKDIVSLLESVF